MTGFNAGIAFLSMILVIELVLAIYSIVSNSRQEKTRSVLHWIESVFFIVLVLASIIQWSLRWYGLAALLLCWSAFGFYRLFGRHAKREYKVRPIVGRFIFSSVLALLAIAPALLFPQYEPLASTGPYAVATARYTYTDTGRVEVFNSSGENRKINIAFWYPRVADGNEKYPLVVFSHGGLGTETSNQSLYLELASHGYVVCSIGHPYHAFWTTSEDGQTTFVSREYFGEILREDASRDKEQSFRYYQKWMETRIADINFVIDTILAKAAGGVDGVYAQVDGARIGVMGHSLGGSAALAIPRQRDDITAVIALESPFLSDITGVEQGKFVWIDALFSIPVLNIYSDSSWKHLSEWSQYAENAALISDSPENAFHLHLSGAGHFSMTDLALTSPLLTSFLEGGQNDAERVEFLEEENQACLDFFNRYLKHLD